MTLMWSGVIQTWSVIALQRLPAPQIIPRNVSLSGPGKDSVIVSGGLSRRDIGDAGDCGGLPHSLIARLGHVGKSLNVSIGGGFLAVEKFAIAQGKGARMSGP